MVEEQASLDVKAAAHRGTRDKRVAGGEWREKKNASRWDAEGAEKREEQECTTEVAEVRRGSGEIGEMGSG